MLRFAAAWVIVWVISIASTARADAGPDQLGSGSDYSLTPILSMQSQPVVIPQEAQAAPAQAPLPQAFWQGLACLTMLLVGWRLCRTVATR
jgi:hypothetical protein